MTVSNVEVYARRPWGGYKDKALPSGTWWAESIVTGDGTGGSMNSVVEMQPAASGRIAGLLFSVEQLSAWDNSNGSHVARLMFENCDPQIEQRQQWHLSMAIGFTPDVSLSIGNVVLPLFFAGMGGDGSDPAAITMRAINQDTIVQRLQIQGYIWDASARSIPGGPRRPPGSLWGT